MGQAEAGQGIGRLGWGESSCPRRPRRWAGGAKCHQSKGGARPGPSRPSRRAARVAPRVSPSEAGDRAAMQPGLDS